MSESPISLRDETGIERFRGTQSPGGGSLPGALRLLDLGLVTFADFNAGAVALYTPADGEFVAVTFSTKDAVEHDFDGGNGGALIGQNNGSHDAPVPSFTLTDWLFFWNTGTIDPVGIADIFEQGSSLPAGGPTVGGAVTNLSRGFMDGTDPVSLVPFAGDGTPINRPVAAWQAAHAYASGDFVLGDGVIYVNSNADGVSGSVEPTWPGQGSGVADGGLDIVWLGLALPATQGALHFYALVGTPAAP